MFFFRGGGEGGGVTSHLRNRLKSLEGSQFARRQFCHRRHSVGSIFSLQTSDGNIAFLAVKVIIGTSGTRDARQDAFVTGLDKTGRERKAEQ